MNNPNTNTNYKYMDDFYKLREELSLKYKDMPFDKMKSELSANTSRINAQIEKIRKEKGIIILKQ